MNRTLRILIIVILAIGAFLVVANITINSLIKNKLESFINRLPNTFEHSYKKLSVQSFQGTLILSDASVILKNNSDSAKHTYIFAEELLIKNIGYWDYLVHDEIHVESINLKNAKIAYHKDKLNPTSDTVMKPLFKVYKPVIVDKIYVENTKFRMFEEGEDSLKIKANNVSIKIEDILLDQNSMQSQIPFKFNTYALEGDSIFVKVSPYENLEVKNFKIENKKAVFNDLALKTKYSRRRLSKIIETERDHYNLTIPQLSVNEIDFGFSSYREFYWKNHSIILKEPKLDIFRDKLVRDDLKPKPLYSKMLRDIPFELTVDSVYLKNAAIVYTEKVKVDNSGGEINFSNLNVRIANLSNTYKSPVKTEISIKSDFMDRTPISADWSFDVQNPNDQFLFAAEIGQMNAVKMNEFTEPNLRVKLEGNTTKTYFTISGNDYSSSTDVKINYSDFKVTILNKEGENKNRLLSAIANIFISKDSKKKDDNYRESSTETIRDRSKSVFNFLWISLKNGLFKSMTGSQK